MARVTVSSKYQIVIPREITTAVGLRPGAEIEIIVLDGNIEVVPVRSSEELKGSLKGINTRGLRDHRDRF
jgi:AbrB family looped-hinge helix DNA binding protein